MICAKYWRFIKRYRLGLVAIMFQISWLAGCSLPFFNNAADIDNKNQSIKLVATTAQDPAQITLNWVTKEDVFQVYRKIDGQSVWGEPLYVGNETTYIDNSIDSGVRYEYMVRRRDISRHKGNVHVDRAYLLTGVDLPPVDERGILLLIVEESAAQELVAEIEQLQNDLIGDGWRIRTQSVSRNASPIEVKGLIRDLYNAEPERLKSVYLLGHVPVPYSGNHAEDGHNNRAWPADIYYGDMDGEWTDNKVKHQLTNNPNVPQDGVFDQITIDGNSANQLLAPELAVGRVDFYDLPLFAPLTEVDLLRRYLQKAHLWRHGELELPRRALIADLLGQHRNSRRGGENAWQNLTPLVGADAIVENSLSSAMSSDGYLWAFGISTGGYTAIHGGFSSRDFRTNGPPIAFYNLFGSYFGDWDTTDNLLRSALAAPTHGLASMWGNWGRWHLHHMGFGATIGESLQATHDPSRGYHFYEHGHRTMVEMNLMGDPTLRLHPFRPVGDVRAKADATNQAIIEWDAAPDATAYLIYRRSSDDEQFVQLAALQAAQLSHTDIAPEAGTYTYMVRALREEETPSGSYSNLAVGIQSNVISLK